MCVTHLSAIPLPPQDVQRTREESRQREGWSCAGAMAVLDLGILRAGSGSGRAKKSPVFFLAARARPDPVAGS